MKEYEGIKWHCTGSGLIKNPEVWWEDDYSKNGKFVMTEKYKKSLDNIEVAEFVMTRGYKNFLKEKRKKEKEQELSILKSKLEYQYKKYGEVDDIDFHEYLYKLKIYNEEYMVK